MACVERLRSLLATGGVASVLLVLFGPTTENPLVSDDFVLLGVVAGGLGQALRYQGGYHYQPLGMAVLHVEQRLFGLDPAGYHWVGLAVHVLTVLLAYRLGRALGVSRGVAWAATFLFATSGLTYEVPLWANVILHSGSTALYLAGLLAYLAHVRGGRAGSLVGFLAALAAALLFHEQAVTLPVACALLLLHADPVPAPAGRPAWLRRHAPALGAAVAITAAYAALKLTLGGGVELMPGLVAGLPRRIGPIALHLVRTFVPGLGHAWAWGLLDPPWPWWLAQTWRAGLVVAGAVALARLARLERLLAAWAIVHVVVMTLAIGMASRHYYLPLVPASLVVALVLARLAARAVRAAGPAAAPRVTGWVLAAVVAPLVATGVVQLAHRRAVWGEAAALGQRLLDDVEQARAAGPARPHVYVVDLPDGLPVGEAEPAFVFRHGFEAALVQWRGVGIAGITRLHSAAPPPRTEPFGRPAAEAEIRALAASPDNLVLRYDPAARRLVRQEGSGFDLTSDQPGRGGAEAPRPGGHGREARA
jgi:hypothetical protein